MQSSAWGSPAHRLDNYPPLPFFIDAMAADHLNPISLVIGWLWRAAVSAVSLFRATEPQALGPSHPLRRFLSRHVAVVSRRPTLIVVASVAISTAFCYLFALLYASGLLAGVPGLLGRDGWRTSVRHLAGDGVAVADVEIRQVWIYGAYMRALDRDVLVQALDVQEKLLGHVLGCELPRSSGASRASGDNGELGSRALFHSSLMHWNCSPAALLSDPDVISTISRHPSVLSPFNVTLTPSSIFGDVRSSFGGAKPISADAVVVTLLYQHGLSHAEGVWTRGAKALASSGKYDMYPSTRGAGYSLCEIHCEPTSTFAGFCALAFTYGTVVAYVLSQLSKIWAVKSRGGLAFAVVMQICVSILAAFATVALLRNRDRTLRTAEPYIPREAYPFVVLVVGLEDTFRLTKAVLETPPEDLPTSRIAKAMGDIGYVTVTTTAQNLALLYLYSKVAVSPEISNFCVFTAVALTLDLVLHMTFFVAVLSIDLRRLGQRDSIGGSVGYSTGASGRVRGGGPSLFELVFRVRTVGTIVLVCFVMALHWRSAMSDVPFPEAPIVEPVPSMLVGATDFASAFTRGVPQAQTQVGWLESQGVGTVKELARAVGLPSYHFIVNIHDPLVFVSKDADRILTSQDYEISLSLLYTNLQLFVSRHRQLVIYIILTSTVAGLLVNHLLRGETVDGTSGVSDAKRPRITVQSLGHGHSIDVIMLAASAKGALASVGLDRRILIWRLQGGQPAVESIVSTPSSPNNTNNRILWPVTAIALDDHAEWLAICPQTGSVSFWNIRSKRFGTSAPVKCGASEGPVSFFFTPRFFGIGGADNARLILVRKGGLMTEIEVSGDSDTVAAAVEHHISPAGAATIFSSHPLHSSRMPLRLVSTTRDGSMHVTTKRGGRIWASERISWPKAQLSAGFRDMEFVPMRALGIMGLVRSATSPDVHLLDVQLSTVICRFRLNNPKPGTLRTIHSSRQPCRSCGASSIASFSIAYTELESGEFAMHTFTPNAAQTERGYLICFRAERDPREKRCAGFEKVSEKVSRLEIRPGTWEGTHFNSISGIRKRPLQPMRGRLREAPSGRTSYQSDLGSYGIVRRWKGGEGGQQPETSSALSEEDGWEAWTMSSTGEVVIRPLSDPALAPDGVAGPVTNLLVTKAEPACPVGKKSVAIGFGDTIKVVQLGTELYDNVGDDDGSQLAVGRRSLAARKAHNTRFVR